ncbi:flagellar hook-length control protein FliK [Marinifilum sp. JC120]|nr:flagellar hook-length control protein FliK [Marinifilum sp. JC120]
MKILPHLDQKNQDLSNLLDRTSLSEDSFRSSMFDNFLYSSQSEAQAAYQPVQDIVNEASSVYEDTASYTESEATEYIDEAAESVAMQSVEEQPQDLQVSREDWNEIKEELEEYGLDKKDISDLEEKVMSENGLTYGQLVSELSGMMKGMKGISLSPIQEQNLNSIFSQLGFNPAESKGLLASIRQGKLGDVVDKMQAKLASMSDSAKLQLSEDETKTLTDMFKLGGDAGKKISQLLTAEGATVGDFKKGFSVLKSALAQQQAAQDAKDLKLVKSVANSLHSAMEKASDQSPSTVRMASAEVISDSMGAAKDVSESAKQDAQNGQNGSNNQAQKDGNPNLKGDSNPGKQNAGQSDDKNSNRHWLEQLLSDSDDQDNWNDFFGKLTDESFVKGEGNLNGNIFGNGMGTLQSAVKSAQVGKTSTMWENTARSNILEQVQEGIFKNLGQGRKQLTLQLNPHDMGTVNVILQVKNRDVQATIRAENPDTAKVIAEQLEVVKQALEEQGLKVEKLEVQTGISDGQTDSSWRNAQDHNSAQYQEMMSEMRKRWQTLREEGTSLAQEMQTVGQKAQISQSGLYIVA